ncbi:hypothetical protein [Maricaulis sp.]|uniref:hypothetical protein n=1 Tax=Maricaulis sp. TaxID=1486257 RepID=UPI0025BF0370|nr:hypothetical protein [Maricaulis sp.]
MTEISSSSGWIEYFVLVAGVFFIVSLVTYFGATLFISARVLQVAQDCDVDTGVFFRWRAWLRSEKYTEVLKDDRLKSELDRLLSVYNFVLSAVFLALIVFAVAFFLNKTS